MGTMSPIEPSRADHRFIKKVMESSFEEAEHVPKEFNLIIAVFKKAGGSWERIFRGSVDDIVLLKKIIKIALKKGRITKKPKWE